LSRGETDETTWFTHDDGTTTRIITYNNLGTDDGGECLIVRVRRLAGTRAPPPHHTPSLRTTAAALSMVRVLLDWCVPPFFTLAHAHTRRMFWPKTVALVTTPPSHDEASVAMGQRSRGGPPFVTGARSMNKHTRARTLRGYRRRVIGLFPEKPRMDKWRKNPHPPLSHDNFRTFIVRFPVIYGTSVVYYNIILSTSFKVV